jgi:hypothetical protein
MQYGKKFRISDRFSKVEETEEVDNANSASEHFIGPKHSPCLELEQGIAEFIHLKIKPGKLITLEVIKYKILKLPKPILLQYAVK